MIGRKGDELVFEIDERSCAVHSHLLHAAIQNSLRFLQIVDARIVAPSVGCKDKRSYEIEFTIRCGSLRISRTIGLTAPGKIALIRSFLMLHVFLAPSPETVEDILFAKLHGSHHSIRHSFGSHIIVLHIADISHGITHLEINLVLAIEYIMEHFVHLPVNISLPIAHFGKEITILVGFESTLFPRQRIKAQPVNLYISSTLQRNVKSMNTQRSMEHLNTDILPSSRFRDLHLSDDIALLSIGSDYEHTALWRLGTNGDFRHLLVTEIHLIIYKSSIRLREQSFPSGESTYFL